MELACLDLEGVLIPEIWIEFAERTGIEELRLTTRDIPDYSELMNRRLAILDLHTEVREQQVLRSDELLDRFGNVSPTELAERVARQL